MPRSVFYLWQVRSFTVKVSLALIDDLNRALTDPRQKQNSELGGILLGRIVQPEVIEITGLEFIPSEHHRGTIYALGLRERHHVMTHVGSLNRRSAAKPVGFFRTHLRPGLFLDQDDFALMTDAFSDPSQIALVIGARSPTGPPSAGIFIWEDGDIDRRKAPLLFPFDSRALSAQGPIEAEQPPQPRRSAPLAAPFRFRLPTIPKPVMAWSVAALACVTLLALGVEYGPVSRRTGPARPLNLRIQHKGDALTVNWDKNATELKQAPSAVLTINDGGSTQKLSLNRDDIEHGNVQFWPRTNDVSVKMDVPNHSDTGAIRTPPPPNPPNTVIVIVKPSPVNAPPAQLTRVTRPKPRPVTKARRTFMAAIPVTPAAPKVASLIAPEAPVIAPRPIPSIVRSVSVSVSVEPRQSSEFRKVVSHVPIFGRSFHAEGGANFSPPRPDQPLEPKVPELIAQNLSREVEVDVKVSIDKHGAVKNAEVLNGRQSELAGIAADSVGSATWEPARQGDRTVSSDVIVHYRFSPRN